MAERIVRIGKWMRRRIIKLAHLHLCALALTVAVLLVSCGGDEEAAEDAPRQLTAVTVRSELLAMMYDEQATRAALDSIVAEKGWQSPEGRAAAAEEARIDSINIVRLDEIIAEYGWPGKSLVGDEAALGAFVVLQHADLPRQQKYLPMVIEAAEKGEAERAHLAMLQDRVRMRQGQEQYYGTQLWNDPSTGEFGLYPIIDSVNVDARRDSVGLGPINDYLRAMGLITDSAE